MARQSRTVGLSPTGIIEQLRQRPYHRPDYFLGLMVLALIAVGMIVWVLIAVKYDGTICIRFPEVLRKDHNESN